MKRSRVALLILISIGVSLFILTLLEIGLDRLEPYCQYFLFCK